MYENLGHHFSGYKFISPPVNKKKTRKHRKETQALIIQISPALDFMLTLLKSYSPAHRIMLHSMTEKSLFKLKS